MIPFADDKAFNRELLDYLAGGGLAEFDDYDSKWYWTNKSDRKMDSYEKQIVAQLVSGKKIRERDHRYIADRGLVVSERHIRRDSFSFACKVCGKPHTILGSWNDGEEPERLCYDCYNQFELIEE